MHRVANSQARARGAVAETAPPAPVMASEQLDRRAGGTALGEAYEDDSVRSQSDGESDTARVEFGDNTAGDSDGGESDAEAGAAAMGSGSDDTDEFFDEDGEGADGGDGGEEAGDMDGAGEREDSDGEDSEDGEEGEGEGGEGEEGEGGDAAAGAQPEGGSISFVVDLGDGFLQTLTSLGFPGLNAPNRLFERNAPARFLWGWEGDLDLPSAHPLVTQAPVEDNWSSDASQSPGRWDAQIAEHLRSVLRVDSQGTDTPMPPATTSTPAPSTSLNHQEPSVVPSDGASPVQQPGREQAGDVAADADPVVSTEPARTESVGTEATSQETNQSNPPSAPTSVGAPPGEVPPEEEHVAMDVCLDGPPEVAPVALPASPPSHERTAGTQGSGADYGVGSLSSLAASLGVSQEVALQTVGIDPQFFEGLPPDIQNEVVLQQFSRQDPSALRQLAQSLRHTTEARQEASNAMEVEAAVEPPATPEGACTTDATEASRSETSAAASAALPPSVSPPELAPAPPSSPEPPTTAVVSATPQAAVPETPQDVSELILENIGEGEIAQDVLDALPDDIRAEVLREQARDRAAPPPEPADPSQAQDMDTASFIATLTPELRQEVLLTMTEEVLRTLPPELVAEAQIVRERMAQRAGARASQETARSSPGVVLGVEGGSWRSRGPGMPAVVVHPGAQGASSRNQYSASLFPGRLDETPVLS